MTASHFEDDDASIAYDMGVDFDGSAHLRFAQWLAPRPPFVPAASEGPWPSCCIRGVEDHVFVKDVRPDPSLQPPVEQIVDRRVWRLLLWASLQRQAVLRT